MSDVKSRWEDLKATVLSVELDILKNIEGNVSAGVRSRKGLRMIKAKAGDLVKLLKEEDQAKKEARKAARTTK